MNQPLSLSETEAQEIMRSLLHKEGCWVDWGKACHILQKAGYDPKFIFEQTGFQASQQNLIIVAAQVYQSIAESGEVSEELLAYFQGPKSDILYEFRVLNQQQRWQAAQFAYEKKLDVDGAKEIARAYKEFGLMSQLPQGFTAHPGDAVAYQCWRKARQKKDLQHRSRLIAQGLKFAHSATAREAIEGLLSDFSVVSAQTAPLLPLYRLEQEEELPRIMPLIHSDRLKAEELLAIPTLEIQEPWRAIKSPANLTLVPIPGWQAVLKAIDPIALVYPSNQLPKTITSKVEDVLVVIDRQAKEWDINSYFLVEADNSLAIRWLEKPSSQKILAQVVLVLRPKKILDEGNITQPWQMDD
ncbi:MAG: hypothetical protein D6756_07135 [Cyanobacteria bacterium J083]|nr:MAG: hypothetical protein D6756_07135 [Cyanobacteria bacterium J083]